MTLNSKLKNKDEVAKIRYNRGAFMPFAVDEVYHLLMDEYGPVTWAPRYDGVSELVACILSQHTSDLNSERAFGELVFNYPTWKMVLEAPLDDIIATITSGGLAKQKAPRIREVLRRIFELRGEFKIDFLKEMPLEEAKNWLKELPGVGPKTAAIVLSFAMGMPAFPVDTHIHRVAKRLGFIKLNVNADHAHDLLEASVPPEKTFPFHVYLINHGRQVCKAQRPLCANCILSHRCPKNGLD